MSQGTPGPKQRTGEESLLKRCSHLPGEIALQWDNNGGERGGRVKANFTIFRVLLGASQVQSKGKEEGREEVRRGRKGGRKEVREGGRKGGN